MIAQTLSALREAWERLDGPGRLRAGYLVAGVLLVAVVWSLLSGMVSGLERKRLAREQVLKELLPLQVSYRAAKQSSDMMAGRMASSRPDDSPARILEETGIKGKSLKITPVKGDDRPGLREDAADVRIEGLTANETVNLLFRLEKGTRPVVVRKASLKSRFDDSSRLDLSMTVAVLKPPAEPSK